MGFPPRSRQRGLWYRGLALGLATFIWPEHKDLLLEVDETSDNFRAEFFGLTVDDQNRVFWNEKPQYGGHCYGGHYYRDVNPKPTTVANALKRLAK